MKLDEAQSDRTFRCKELVHDAWVHERLELAYRRMYIYREVRRAKTE